MTGRLIYAALICASLSPLMARAQLAATAGTTNIVLVSGVISEPAWKRQVVMMRNPSGEIYNDDGKVGSAASSAAIDAAASAASEICDAANAAMLDALADLDAAKANAATNAIGLALAIMPETSRTNLTAYVVKTESDGVTDTQWVWYNRDIALAPNRYVVYATFGRAETNKVVWTDWTNTVTVVENSRTWEGCHVCTVSRPSWARGESCLDLPNDMLGGPSGFDFGDMLLTVGGVPAYTGFVTNGVTGAVLYFDNGFLKDNPETQP